MDVIKRFCTVRGTTRVSAIAIGLASYHILVFTLWFGGSSHVVVMSPHTVYCKSEGVFLSPLGSRHVQSKHPCEKFDVSLCEHLSIGYNSLQGLYYVDNKENTPDWIIDNCLDIARVEGKRGWMTRFFDRFLSVFKAWMSVLTAVIILLLVRIN